MGELIVDIFHYEGNSIWMKYVEEESKIQLTDREKIRVIIILSMRKWMNVKYEKFGNRNYEENPVWILSILYVFSIIIIIIIHEFVKSIFLFTLCIFFVDKRSPIYLFSIFIVHWTLRTGMIVSVFFLSHSCDDNYEKSDKIFVCLFLLLLLSLSSFAFIRQF